MMASPQRTPHRRGGATRVAASGDLAPWLLFVHATPMPDAQHQPRHHVVPECNDDAAITGPPAARVTECPRQRLAEGSRVIHRRHPLDQATAYALGGGAVQLAQPFACGTRVLARPSHGGSSPRQQSGVAIRPCGRTPAHRRPGSSLQDLRVPAAPARGDSRPCCAPSGWPEGPGASRHRDRGGWKQTWSRGSRIDVFTVRGQAAPRSSGQPTALSGVPAIHSRQRESAITPPVPGRCAALVIHVVGNSNRIRST